MDPKSRDHDPIHISEPKNEDGWKNCIDPCSTKCFHWIFDKKTPEDQWEHLITKHPYYFPYAYNEDPATGELVKVRVIRCDSCRRALEISYRFL